ncbi:MAG: response regulator [Gemmataceae bacterium]
MTHPTTASAPVLAIPEGAEAPGILIVDDEPAVLEMLERGLRRHGFRVHRATAHDAIEVFSRQRDGIAMAVIDVKMDGKGGPEVATALRELDPQLRFCFMSADFGGHTAGQLYDLGAERILEKPFGPAEMARTLNELLQR